MQTFFRDAMLVLAEHLTIPSHQKLSRLLSRLRQRGDLELVIDFEPCTTAQWSAVHDPEYVRLVIEQDAATFEAASIPASSQMTEAILHSAGSLMAATAAAAKTGCSFSPTAGFHRAHWSRPGPFCLLNVLPLAARYAVTDLAANRVLILDCDFHRGDGTDDILSRINDERIHHESLGFTYTRPTQAAQYLRAIEQICQSIEHQQFDFVIYQAGMDVLIGDPAGGGLLSLLQTRERDSLVFTACRRGGVPVVWNLAGGYRLPAENGYDPVVEGHLNTYECAARTFA